jgi:hypothetical protein
VCELRGLLEDEPTDVGVLLAADDLTIVNGVLHSCSCIRLILYDQRATRRGERGVRVDVVLSKCHLHFVEKLERREALPPVSVNRFQ